MLGLPSDRRFRTLVHLAQQGAADAFSALYDLFADPLFRYFRCGIGATQPAAALVAHTFQALTEAIQEVCLPRRDAAVVCVGWFYTFAAGHLRAATLAQRPHQHLTVRALGAAIEGDVLWTPMRAAGPLPTAFARLTPEQQVVVVLRCVERSTLADIARSLLLSVAHVTAVLHDGLAVLNGLVLVHADAPPHAVAASSHPCRVRTCPPISHRAHYTARMWDHRPAIV